MLLFPQTIELLKERFADQRCKRVVFISHCLLNENTRYMGGAFCSGVNPEIATLLTQIDCGVVQMICPERVAWGGVYKPDVYQFLGVGQAPLIRRLLLPMAPLFLFLLARRMKWVARYTASEIADYHRNGMRVMGVIGVGGSPACGVSRHPDLREYFEWGSQVDIATVTRDEQNAVINRVCKDGPGIFIAYLRRELGRRGIDVEFAEYDLFDEAEGKPNLLLRTFRINPDAD